MAGASDILLEKLVALLREQLADGLLGVLATGSRIQGLSGPSSDLDVHAVIAAPRRRRRNLVLDGVEVELSFNPPSQVRRYFAEGASTIHMFAFGRIVYDPQHVLAGLQAQARALWAAGPPPLDEPASWRRRYVPADLLRDLHDVGDDEATATLLTAALVDTLIATDYQLARRWQQKLKRRLWNVERWDPRTAQLARAALQPGVLSERKQAAADLAQHVLAPLGGLMPLEWEIEWEELQP